MIYDTIRLGGEDRNAERLGTYVAWLVINHLLDAVLERSAGTAVVRVRLQDLSGAGFLTTVLHGELKSTHLNDTGRAFTEHYLASGNYDADYGSCEYQGEDEWLRYAAIASRITAAFRRYQKPVLPSEPKIAKIIQFPSKTRN